MFVLVLFYNYLLTSFYNTFTSEEMENKIINIISYQCFQSFLKIIFKMKFEINTLKNLSILKKQQTSIML